MARYIDADKIYEQIAEKEDLARQRVIDTPSRLPNGDFNPYATRYATQLDERTTFKFMIADAPAADVAPVKHGHWIVSHGVLAGDDIYGDMGECSNCGLHLRDWEWYYCPRCGAKMEGEENV